MAIDVLARRAAVTASPTASFVEAAPWRSASNHCLKHPGFGESHTDFDEDLVRSLHKEIWKELAFELESLRLEVTTSTAIGLFLLMSTGAFGLLLAKAWRRFALACRSAPAAFVLAAIGTLSLVILSAVSIVMSQNELTRLGWTIVTGKFQHKSKGVINYQLGMNLPLRIYNPTSAVIHIPGSSASFALRACGDARAGGNAREKFEVGGFALSALTFPPRDNGSFCFEAAFLEDENVLEVIEAQRCLWWGTPAEDHLTFVDVKFEALDGTLKLKILGDHDFSVRAFCTLPLALTGHICDILTGPPQMFWRFFKGCERAPPKDRKKRMHAQQAALLKSAVKGLQLYHTSKGRVCEPLNYSFRGPVIQSAYITFYCIVFLWGVALALCCGAFVGEVELRKAEAHVKSRQSSGRASEMVRVSNASVPRLRSATDGERAVQTELQDFAKRPSGRNALAVPCRTEAEAEVSSRTWHLAAQPTGILKPQSQLEPSPWNDSTSSSCPPPSLRTQVYLQPSTQSVSIATSGQSHVMQHSQAAVVSSSSATFHMGTKEKHVQTGELSYSHRPPTRSSSPSQLFPNHWRIDAQPAQPLASRRQGIETMSSMSSRTTPACSISTISSSVNNANPKLGWRQQIFS